MSKRFSPVTWAHSTNIYEVNVRQYTPEGTFNAFAKSLPRLRDMGVQTLWFMPVTPISVKNRKGTLGSYYACSDYMAVNPEFGSTADFKKMVRKAHQLGMRVMIDWVANHTGWDHVWTLSHPEFFDRNEEGEFLPPFPDWEDVIHLDYSNPDLWKAMIEAMKFWVRECDIDAFRCDMAHLVPLEFWAEARTQLDALKPLLWLAETEEPRYHEVFDASYTWELLHTMEKIWKRETGINGLDAVLFKYDNFFPARALRIFFTSNHDENSHSGTEYERMGDAALPFSVFCATWNAIPLVYSGQELPMRDKRLNFFDKDPIPWGGENTLHEFYKTLLHLHSDHPALRAGDPEVRTYRLDTTHNSHVFAFLRKSADREVMVLLNLSPDEVRCGVLGKVAAGHYRDIFSDEVIDMDSNPLFEMGKWSYRICER